MRLARDVAIFLALQAAVFLAVDAAYMRYVGREHYLASLRDKTARLAEVRPPRILLVGGSNAAFGVNSAALERSSGRPVVNLGLNAGLGRDFILAQASAAVQPGDLVVLMPEYDFLAPYALVDAPTLLLVMRLAPETVRFVPLSAVPQLLDHGLGTVTVRLRALGAVVRGQPWRDPLYYRQAFDARGDMTAHLALPPAGAGGKHGGVWLAQTAGPACRRLSDFARDAHARGARVVIVPPPIPGDDAVRQAEAIAALWERVDRETGIPVLGARKIYDRSLFLDTAYHLAASGREQRTRHLVDLLRRFEDGSAAGTPRP
ncbi:MAG: hypothetical protein ABW221_04990 [Vicinamibacteria bacterium]